MSQRTSLLCVAVTIVSLTTTTLHLMSSDKFSKIDLATSTQEFLTLIDRYKNGNPPGPGWGVYEDFVCPECGVEQVVVAMVNTIGFHCNYCGVNLDVQWNSDGSTDGVYLNPVGYMHARVNHN